MLLRWHTDLRPRPTRINREHYLRRRDRRRRPSPWSPRRKPKRAPSPYRPLPRPKDPTISHTSLFRQVQSVDLFSLCLLSCTKGLSAYRSKAVGTIHVLHTTHPGSEASCHGPKQPVSRTTIEDAPFSSRLRPSPSTLLLATSQVQNEPRPLKNIGPPYSFRSFSTRPTPSSDTMPEYDSNDGSNVTSLPEIPAV